MSTGDTAPARRSFVVFVSLTVVAGVALAAGVLRGVDPLDWHRLGIAGVVIIALLLLSELRPLVTAGSGDPYGVPVSTTFVCALLLRWGLPTAVVAQAAAYVVADIVKRRHPWRTVFNASQQTLAYGAIAGVLHLGGVDPSIEHPAVMHDGTLLLFAVGAVAYFLVNEGLVVRVVSLHQRTPFWAMIRADGPYDAFVTSALLALGPLVVLAAERGPVFVPLLLLPLFAVYRTASLSVDKEHQAQHDALTGLPNRKLLLERTAAALRVGGRDAGRVGFCLIDLDRFKEVNDTLGHLAGDRLLRLVSERLAARLREGDTVARLGGDEFAVLLSVVADTLEAADVVRRLRAALDEPFDLEGLRIDVQASVGIAVYPEHAGDVETLLQRADIAMYVAKQRRTGSHVYDASEDGVSLARLGLLGELRRALEDDELLLHYQPKVALQSRAPTEAEVVGLEALVRWEHPVRGLVPPDEFLPLAEQCGLMRLVTSRVLDLALRQVAAWSAAGPCPPVSVNITAADLADPGFSGLLAEGLAEHGVAPGLLVLEITEQGVLVDDPVVAETLAALEGLRVGLSLDDFGTGFSSLAHLVRVPVTELKVDRSFVARLGTDGQATTVVRSVIDLGHALGLWVVAEGVEDEATWDQLAAMGCDEAQGWLISRALPPAAVVAWLTARAAVPAQAVVTSGDTDRPAWPRETVAAIPAR